MSADDLRRRLEAAYAAIRELDEDHAAGRMSAKDHAELKARSERQAAALLKRLREAEQHGAAAPRREPVARVPLGARLKSPVALALGAVALTAASVGVGVLLARSASDERAAMPAAAPAPGGRGDGAAVSAGLDALRKEVEPESAPTKKLLAFAHLALDEGQIPAAIWAYRRVLGREPKNVEAITHMGLILSQGQHVDQALARIEEALAIDPAYAHAYWDRAHILFKGKKDYAAAARAFEAFLAIVPAGEDADRARAMLREARGLAGTAAPRSAPPAAGRPG